MKTICIESKYHDKYALFEVPDIIADMLFLDDEIDMNGAVKFIDENQETLGKLKHRLSQMLGINEINIMNDDINYIIQEESRLMRQIG